MLQNTINEFKSLQLMNEAMSNEGINYIIKVLNACEMKDLRMIVSAIIENDNFFCGLIINNNDSAGILIA